MKVVILAGGFGTRLNEYTDAIPKPMVPINDVPILIHIMECYARYGYTDFIIALGYKQAVVKEYFWNFRCQMSDFTVNLGDGSVGILEAAPRDWNVSLIDTGLNTSTGGRLKRLAPLLYKETNFMFTYGDGLCNVDIEALEHFHCSHGRAVTMTAVRPKARFGELDFEGGGSKVKSFVEKPQLTKGWINGGFFVAKTEFLDLIDGDDVMFEKEPLEIAASTGNLEAYFHEGFWQCMDNKKDKDLLEALALQHPYPWMA